MFVRTTLAGSMLCLAMVSTAAADIEIHQNHRFDARPGMTVVVDVSFHSIDVTVAPGGSVDVTVDVVVKGSGGSAKNAANSLQPRFLVKGDTMIIKSTHQRRWPWRSVSAKGMVTIAMPPGVNLSIDASSGGTKITGDLGDAVIDFDASSGSLNFDGAAHELHADISSGSVGIAVMRPLDDFSVDASSGSVRLVGGAHQAHIDTSSGSINVAGLLGDGYFNTSSGSITAQWTAIAHGTNVRAEASSGSVNLTFPGGTQLDGSVDVSSGRIHSDFPGTASKRHLTLQGGLNAVNLTVATSSGSVTLHAN
jgi:hypothetical protein